MLLVARRCDFLFDRGVRGVALVRRLRRRDSGYPEPPPQTRTRGFLAPGSSVALTYQADRHSDPFHGPVV